MIYSYGSHLWKTFFPFDTMNESCIFPRLNSKLLISIVLKGEIVADPENTWNICHGRDPITIKLCYITISFSFWSNSSKLVRLVLLIYPWNSKNINVSHSLIWIISDQKEKTTCYFYSMKTTFIITNVYATFKFCYQQFWTFWWTLVELYLHSRK